jgi:hypothetical protein
LPPSTVIRPDRRRTTRTGWWVGSSRLGSLVKRWSNAGQTLVKHSLSIPFLLVVGRISTTCIAGQTLVKRWSNTHSQSLPSWWWVGSSRLVSLVKRWSNAGQTLTLNPFPPVGGSDHHDLDASVTVIPGGPSGPWPAGRPCDAVPALGRLPQLLSWLLLILAITDAVG